jgi:DNA-binding NarL/FixJ family response regulator
MSTIRVALIEDHDVVRIGLRTVLQSQPGIEVVGEATNGIEGLALLQTTQVDVALVDIGLPGMDGIELTQQFRQFQQQQPELITKMLMLTMQGNEATVLASFAAGADAYCMKDIGSEQLIEAIRLTHNGHAWIDPAIASIVLRQMRQGMVNPTTPSEADYQDSLGRARI